MKKIRMPKMLSALLALTLLVSALAVPASAVSNRTIDNILFDSTYYAEHNPDVVNALGRSTSALRNHYLNYGQKEGRAPSNMFDPVFYLNRYPDLKAAFNNNYTAAYNHFVSYGISEGRQGSATFSVQTYKANYADLRNAFGSSSSSNWKYLQHWIQYGRSENRNATTSLNNTTSTVSNASAASTTQYVRTSGGNLNMRSGAGTSYSVVAKLANGTAVTVHSTANGWAKISANGKTGYVSTQYLNSTASTSSTTTSSSSWAWPLSNYTVTQSFNHYSSSMASKGRPYHCGIDLVSSNTTVCAAASGTVVYKGYSNGNGYHVILSHTVNGVVVKTLYSHLSSYSTCPAVGQSVTTGQQIGVMGSTGNSTGVHLHFATFTGNSTDPYGYTPASSANKIAYGNCTFFNPAYVISNNGSLP